ncbi:family 43 glycosylhydrolase [Leeuwenhoekiella parthenopeia]|uniref:Family 43 glycosylhydrolase n=1 Tax=Leeuwenhoekiella parthenopeia TaxID=2890320 RepID=A0ABS8GQ26_9FLAO|nr:family 43 glycosylhydrolase [Leeuwenhoekiella parthenopeia]MCC4211261.1 family 43 glycosylhydrolase [Leeuwenhoekiella parthenopeia]
MNTIRFNFLLLFLFSLSGLAQKKNSNTTPYPYNNPVIQHMYTADAAPHVMPDGKVWMVTSVDHENGGGYSTMHKYHTFSSPDMVNWTDHGEVLNIYDVIGANEEPEGEDWALWAPDMIYYNNKYYLYFPVRIVLGEDGGEGNREVISYTAVAVSDAPDKHFKIISKKIEGTRGIDPAVFIDDDGERYLYYGQHFGAKLKENMIELDGEPVKMEVDDNRFMEAIWMNKKAGKYWISYHSHYGKPVNPENPDDINRDKSRLDYGISDSPLGPFEYKGPLNFELGVNVQNGPKLPNYEYVPWRLYQSNHGGIVEFHGTEYLFYHTSALSSWRQDSFKGPGTWTQRSVCIDKIEYSDGETIRPVQQTLKGVDEVVVDQPYEIVLPIAKIKKKSNTLTFKNVDLGTGYYYASLEADNFPKGSKISIYKDSASGPLLGTLVSTGTKITETFLRDANGFQNIILVFDESASQASLNSFRFFAGAPIH